MADRKRHVAIFCFPYGGHGGPLLNLAIKLARAAPQVTFSFFTTDTSKQFLFPSKPNSLNADIPENIKPYVVWDGIPEGQEILRQHLLERVNLFLRAGPHNLKEGVRLAVSETKKRVTCVISDAFVTPALDVAQELGVPWLALWISHSCSLSAHFYTDLIRQKCGSGEESLGFIPGLSVMRIQDLPHEIVRCFFPTFLLFILANGIEPEMKFIKFSTQVTL